MQRTHMRAADFRRLDGVASSNDSTDGITYLLFLQGREERRGRRADRVHMFLLRQDVSRDFKGIGHARQRVERIREVRLLWASCPESCPRLPRI
jgi:hypothetical protein